MILPRLLQPEVEGLHTVSHCYCIQQATTFSPSHQHAERSFRFFLLAIIYFKASEKIDRVGQPVFHS